ncbi:DUF6925 family protein [Rhodoligotrophos defluvii]|uniref:DUF6925 family protein n=1 Tax=Rhodoligotrophos defluvii TaxID=2561934 RepID=UPI0010C9E9B3|nr:hypothetical protein [Rhodoligotrophos defluvii]
MSNETLQFIRRMIADQKAGWSLGTFGAIAEFTRDEGEAVAFGQDGLSAATSRGAIRIAHDADIRIFAYEAPAKDPASWHQAVALCLPKANSLMSHRRVVTELGPDEEAVREMDRGAILFDIGLGTPTVDVCVRSMDPAVIARLREAVGTSIFDPDNTLMRDMPALSPHRVFATRLGRAEIMQPVPAAHEKSPEGPHTHVLPQLLSQGRTHSANEPIPFGWVPCAYIYPQHPLKDPLGRDIPFDPAALEAFRDVLSDYGDPELAALKTEIEELVWSGASPEALPKLTKRSHRATLRVTLRQLKCQAEGDTGALDLWREYF